MNAPLNGGSEEKAAGAVKSPVLPKEQSIHSRAMLVAVRISSWRARKFDKRVTDQVHEQHGAAGTSGKYSKHLFAGEGAAHTKISAAVHNARNLHYEHTLPWSDDGWRLLPTANYDKYTDAMRGARVVFDRAVNDFMLEYPAMIQRAEVRLGSIYRASDYPSPLNIQRLFSFDMEFQPVPSGSDFRLSLPADQLEDIERGVAARVQASTQEAMHDAWNRLGETVQRIGERLSGNPERIRDALFDNAKEMVDLLGRLNVTNDEDMERLRGRVARELAAHSVSRLRDSKDLRKATAAKAASILSEMADFYTPVKEER